MSAPTTADLRKISLFEGLDDRELSKLAEASRVRHLAAQDVLFYEGDALEPALRFVLSGGIQIRKTAASGKETVVRLIRAGDMFGVAALFDRKVAPATASATESTEVLEIHGQRLFEELTHDPEIAIKLLVTFAQRLRETQDALHAVISDRAKARLARQILATLEQEGGLGKPDPYKLKTKLPHATLSRMVGITYEECVRLIREWSHDPAILRYERGGVITVLDREALEHVLEED